MLFFLNLTYNQGVSIMSNLIDLVNKKFGRWIVLSRSGVNKFGRITWLCECSCGIKKEVDGQALRSGDSTSCGCYISDVKSQQCIDRNTTHGMSKTIVYRRWSEMLSRCNNKNSTSYSKYGAKGIYVHPRWSSFENFFEDMGLPPSDEHSIDRINSKLSYTPDNCRWATMKQQQNNRSSNRWISCKIDGKFEHKTLQQWADLVNIPRKTISNRIARGWDVPRALGFTK